MGHDWAGSHVIHGSNSMWQVVHLEAVDGSPPHMDGLYRLCMPSPSGGDAQHAGHGQASVVRYLFLLANLTRNCAKS